MAKRKNWRSKVKQYRSRDLKTPTAAFLGTEKRKDAGYDSMTKRQKERFDKRLLREQAAAVESLRREIVRRDRQFEHRGLYSHGMEVLKRKLSQVGFSLENPVFNEKRQTVGVDLENRQNQRMALLQAYAAMRHFLDPQQTATNSVQGIFRVNKEQDRFIFGTDEKGNPRGSLGKSWGEREKYWALVDAIRESDVIKANDLYFFQSEGFIKLWKDARRKGKSVEEMAEDVQKFFEQRYQDYPPTTDSTATKDGGSADDTVNYLAGEISRVFERRGIN